MAINTDRRGHWTHEFGRKSGYNFPCPGCAYLIDMRNHFFIEVNCESKGKIRVPNFLVQQETCDTPTCPWSKLTHKFSDIRYVTIKGGEKGGGCVKAIIPE